LVPVSLESLWEVRLRGGGPGSDPLFGVFFMSTRRPGHGRFCGEKESSRTNHPCFGLRVVLRLVDVVHHLAPFRVIAIDTASGIFIL